ncbi:hypothetical protein STENM36S_01463 [Streptomyces tendae]
MAPPVDPAALIHATPAERPHLVFDLGGTWFRRGVRRPDGVLEQVARQPAVNYLNHLRLSPPELRQGLVEYVLTETRRLAPPDSGRSPRVSISMGAALNGHTGVARRTGWWT